MTRMLRLFKPGRGAKRPQRQRTLLYVEPLEDRLLLSSAIYFASATVTGSEADGTISATVTIDPQATEAGEFYVQVNSGSASNGADFTPHLGHVQFSSGATSISVQLIHPMDDGCDESDEDVTVELVAVSGVTIGEPSTITVTIEDNDDPPASLGPDGPDVLTPDLAKADQAAVAGAFYGVSLASGDLTAGYTLPAVAGRAGVELVYNSSTAAPQPIFLVRHTLDDTATPNLLGATLTLNSVAENEVFYSDESLSPSDRVQLALQADASGLATGVYSYVIDVVEYGSPNIPTEYDGQVAIVNRADSPFGSGWSIAGLDRLHVVTSGVLLELDSGLTLWFAEDGGDYISPAGDFSTLVQNLDGSFTRTLANGVAFEFDSLGKQTAVVDRNGNTTSYAYASGVLSSITDPFGLVTTFTISSGKITAITDAAERVTALGYSGDLLVNNARGPAATPREGTWKRRSRGGRSQ